MKAGKIVLLFAAAVMPCFIGIAISAISMVVAFHELGDKGTADPSQLAARVGKALVVTQVGLIVSAILFIAAMIYCLCRAKRQTSSSPI